MAISTQPAPTTILSPARINTMKRKSLTTEVDGDKKATKKSRPSSSSTATAAAAAAVAAAAVDPSAAASAGVCHHCYREPTEFVACTFKRSKGKKMERCGKVFWYNPSPPPADAD